jgi:hypothetical protein
MIHFGQLIPGVRCFYCMKKKLDPAGEALAARGAKLVEKAKASGIAIWDKL